MSDEPVGALVLADMLEVDVETVQKALDVLRERLSDEESGVQLREVAGGWRLYTHPRYHALIEKYVISWDTRRLSQAALETLAVIAYCQPITRAGIASVRGVNSDSPVNSLVEKGLCGRRARTPQAPDSPYCMPRRVLFSRSSASPRFVTCPISTSSLPTKRVANSSANGWASPVRRLTMAESLFDEDELSLNLDFQGEQDKGSMFGYESAKATEE